MSEHKAELDKLRKRHADLGEAITDLMDSISQASSTTEEVLAKELSKARKEIASIAKRLKDLSGEED